MTRPGRDTGTLPLDRLPGLTAFTHLVDEVAGCIDAGALAPGDPFLVATGLWTAVHGITSLLIARPDFPWPDLDQLLSHVFAVHGRGMAPPA
jgi:hypothetical protein